MFDRSAVRTQAFPLRAVSGGRNWNEFLSCEDESYIEIQAGLAHTQLEHIPMPANSEWEWVEAYTALDCEPDKLYGEYSQAVSTIGEYLTSRVGDPHSLIFRMKRA